MKESSPLEQLDFELAQIDDSLFRNDRIIITLIISAMGIILYCALAYGELQKETQHKNTTKNITKDSSLNKYILPKKNDPRQEPRTVTQKMSNA